MTTLALLSQNLFRLARPLIHSSDAVSVTTAWWTTPSFFGTSTRCNHGGNPFETSFCQNPLVPMPAG